jgi:1-acyl-sn-glycerol-3-phosphate acyltransferase
MLDEPQVVTAGRKAPTKAATGSSATILLMNLWCYPLLALWTLCGILVFPLALGLCRLVLRRPVDCLVRWFIWLYGRGWLVLMSPFVRFRREGMHYMKTDRPCMLVVNHLSFFDTYCMSWLPVHDITFAVRSWPFRIFFYGGFMRLARYVDVEGSDWAEILRKCQSAFDAGGSVLFFPEGHRSRDGQLQRFYAGAFQVSINSGVPLVPLCVLGTETLLPPGRKLMHPCRIRLRALEPIDTSFYRDADGHARLRKLVRERMASALSEMRQENAS